MSPHDLVGKPVVLRSGRAFNDGRRVNVPVHVAEHGPLKVPFLRFPSGQVVPAALCAPAATPEERREQYRPAYALYVDRVRALSSQAEDLCAGALPRALAPSSNRPADRVEVAARCLAVWDAAKLGGWRSEDTFVQALDELVEAGSPIED